MNASAAFWEAVRRSMRMIRQTLRCVRVEPALLTAARLQYDDRLRRKIEAQTIRAAVARKHASKYPPAKPGALLL